MNKVIVLAHQKGGVGKSTIAANLASELSKDHKVKVIDLDLQKSLSYFNNLRGEAGLQILDMITIESAKKLVEIINNNTDLLIIDAGGYDSDIIRVAILGADILVTPVSDSGIEIGGLLMFRDIIKKINEERPDLKASILLNKIHTRAGESSLNEVVEFIDKTPEFQRMDSVLRDRVDYKRAFDSGKSVIEFNSKATAEMKNLISEVLKHG